MVATLFHYYYYLHSHILFHFFLIFGSLSAIFDEVATPSHNIYWSISGFSRRRARS